MSRKEKQIEERVFLARGPLAYFPKHRVACSSDITPDDGMGEVAGGEESRGEAVKKKQK